MSDDSNRTPNRKTTILLSGAGGAGTIEVIRTLHALGSYRIVAIDASEHAGGFPLSDCGYIVPMATERRFPHVVREIICKEQPAFIIPLVDEEILPLQDLLGELGGSGLRLVTPERRFCEVALDKWLTFLALRDAGIPTPDTHLASDGKGWTFPCVIKPRDGRGSREVAYLKRSDDVGAYLARAPREADHYVVQEHIAGREYTVSVVVALGGPTLAVVPKEVIIKKGITQVGITRIVPEIDRACRQIQDQLGANGPFNVQLIIADDGTPTVIEINPRYSTTVALTIAAGINEVDVVIRHALGEPIGPLAFQPNLMMVRYPTQMYVPESEWPPSTVTQWGVAVEQGAHQG